MHVGQIEELKQAPVKLEDERDALLKQVLPKLPPEAANVVNDLSGLVKKKKKDVSATESSPSSTNAASNGSALPPSSSETTSKRKAEEMENGGSVTNDKKARIEDVAE
jgi:hypothetical protein